MAPTKDCPICRSQVASFLTSPKTCRTKEGHSILHTEKESKRACGECWELHLSKEVEERPIRDSTTGSKGKHLTSIQCMFCPSPLSEEELMRLSHKHTNDRYLDKKDSDNWRICQDRCQGAASPRQPFNSFTDGSVFMCQHCSFATCVDCDRPEHVNESCEQYRDRITKDPIRIAAELATRNNAAFKDAAILGHCPNCDTAFDNVEKACGHVTCSAGTEMTKTGIIGGCGFRFCSGCLIPWVGDASAYLGGRMQHKQGCKHRFELCKKCNRKEHPGETCEEYLVRLKPIADAKDHKNKSMSGERHWETTHGAINRFVMSKTFMERATAKKVRTKEAKAKSKNPEGGVDCRKRKLPAEEKVGSKAKSAKRASV